MLIKVYYHYALFKDQIYSLRNLAPEEILFLKVGNLARFSLSNCSMLTVIKPCMSPLVYVCVCVLDSGAVFQFPHCVLL